MSNIEAVYFMLTALITIPLFFSLLFAIKYVLKIIKLHKYRKWYTKTNLIKNIIWLVLLTLAFLFVLNVHSTGTAPSKANDLAKEAFAAMSTSIMIYRAAFMYLVVTPIFIALVYKLYKTIFIVIRMKKQKKDLNENKLLKSLKMDSSLQITKSFEDYLVSQESNKTTRFSYSDDSFILKCLVKNNNHNLAKQMADIIERKQKQRKYSMTVNNQYRGDNI